MYTGKSKENWVTLWNVLSHHLEYHLQLKTKDVGGGRSWLWKVIRKSTVNEGMVVVSTFSTDESLKIHSHPPLAGAEKRTHLQTEISLSGNVSYQRVTYTWSSELLLCSLFLRNNQPKIILMPESHILEWQILLPFTQCLKWSMNLIAEHRDTWNSLLWKDSSDLLVLSMLGDVAWGFSWALSNCYSLRLSHFPTYRNRSVLSNSEVILTLKNQRWLNSDWPQILNFYSLYRYTYIVYSDVNMTIESCSWGLKEFVLLWRTSVWEASASLFTLSLVFRASQFFMEVHNPFWPMIKLLLRESLSGYFGNYTGYHFCSNYPSHALFTDPIRIK